MLTASSMSCRHSASATVERDDGIPANLLAAVACEMNARAARVERSATVAQSSSTPSATRSSTDCVTKTH